VNPAIEVVIETPKGSQNKLKFDPLRQRFRLSHVLPAGIAFPFDFGFVPETRRGAAAAENLIRRALMAAVSG
jgi:inorganic pyrophosphatase